MENIEFNGTKIKDILDKTIDSIEQGKSEMFNILENTRTECEILKEQLKEVQETVTKVIKEVEELEDNEKLSKQQLLIVSKNFNIYSEDDIKKAYQSASQFMSDLSKKRQEEVGLIKLRNSLELRLKNSLSILGSAENMISQVGVAMDYLKGNLNFLVESVDVISENKGTGIKIIDAQEKERSRIARDIHDGPAQSMSNIILQSELCHKLIDSDVARTKLELNELKGLVKDSLKDIRRIIYDLKPINLNELGLITTVENYSEDFTIQTNINVNVIVIKDKFELSNITQIGAFRIIQESLNNIKKHARATNVNIKFEFLTNYITIIIEDNGKGFDTKVSTEKNSSSGFGLVGMKERAEFLKADIEIYSEIGKGTKVILKIPVKKDDTNNE